MQRHRPVGQHARFSAGRIEEELADRLAEWRQVGDAGLLSPKNVRAAYHAVVMGAGQLKRRRQRQAADAPGAHAKLYSSASVSGPMVSRSIRPPAAEAWEGVAMQVHFVCKAAGSRAQDERAIQAPVADEWNQVDKPVVARDGDA
jgi:hypothetical protein